MKKLKRKLAARLRGNRGETLTEVLVALLIAALALTMLASVIHSSSTMIQNSKKFMNDYYEANDELALQSGSGETKTLKLVIAVDGSETSDEVNLKLNTAPEVEIYTNSTISSKPVISYRLHE